MAITGGSELFSVENPSKIKYSSIGNNSSLTNNSSLIKQQFSIKQQFCTKVKNKKIAPDTFEQLYIIESKNGYEGKNSNNITGLITLLLHYGSIYNYSHIYERTKQPAILLYIVAKFT